MGVVRRAGRGAIMSIERARDLRKQMPPAEAKLWLTLQTPERPATPTLMPSPQGGGEADNSAPMLGGETPQ